ncbi:hypothetical protein NSTC731_05802 [Nostoc sp. DSM 114167]|jgi:hypothetical protein
MTIRETAIALSAALISPKLDNTAIFKVNNFHLIIVQECKDIFLKKYLNRF